MLQPRAAFRTRGFVSAALRGTTALAVVGLLGLAAATAGAAELGRLVKVTGGASPFTGCRADQVGRQPGTNYPNSEIEPWVAANPTEPGNLLAGHQQDRWSNGGSRGLVADVSRDGGITWRRSVPRGITLCTDGPFQRSSDPWVTFSPNGVGYFMHLAVNITPAGELGRNAMLVSRSTNGGRTWGRPITLIDENIPTVVNDKNSITADPRRPRYAYAVWDRLQGALAEREEGGGGLPGAAASAGQLDGVALVREHIRAVEAGRSILFDSSRQSAAARELPPKGPTLFTRTTNGGRTWERPRVIYDPGVLEQTIGNVVVVLPNGTLVNFFTHIDFVTANREIQLIRSTNLGVTWERRPTTVARIVNGGIGNSGTITPNKQVPVRDAYFLFHPAVDPRNGNLYVVWQDVRLSGVQQVLLAASTDGGNSWTLNGPMNQTPPSFLRLRQQAFVPSVEVGPRGEVVITYYDFRNDRNMGELTDHWVIHCEPSRRDCLSPSNYTEVRLTNQPFNLLLAPDAGGRFLGDYMGLVRSGNAVHAVFGIADGLNRTSLFTRKIDFGPGRALVAAAQP
jgi:hypothetical protein